MKKESTYVEMNDLSLPTKKQISDDSNFKLLNNDVKKEEKKEELLIVKIDNLYMSIKTQLSYYSKLRIILLITLLMYNTIILYFFKMVSVPTNNTYCYDQFNKEFIICDISEICSNSKEKMINLLYIEDNYTNPDTLQENININKNYTNFFLQEMLLFSNINYNLVDKHMELLSHFNNIAIVSYKEKYNLFLAFNLGCQRTQVFLEFLSFVWIGLIIGNLIFGFISDVFGRKKLIVLNTFLCGLSTIGLAIFTSNLMNISQVNLDNSNFQLPKQNIFTKDLYNDYILKFTEIENNIQKNNLVHYYFSKYKLLFYLLVFLVSINISSSTCISYAYMLENSFNDSETYYNYNVLAYSHLLSFILNYIFAQSTHNFHIPFYIIGGVLLVCGIFQQICFYESPRHLFEFYEYDEITKIFLHNFKIEEIKKFKVDIKKPMFKTEILNSQISYKESTLLGTITSFINKKTNSIIKDFPSTTVFRSDLIANPKLMINMMMKNKYIRKNYLILCSLIINISFVFFMLIFSLNKSFVFSRSDLYIKFNPNIVGLVIITFISQGFFYLIMKFYGSKIILFICFGSTFIFSLLFHILELKETQEEDLNIYYFNSSVFIYDQNRRLFFCLICLITFFAYGLFYILYLYLIKYTKTVYRCFFLGICYFLVDSSLALSACLLHYFDVSMFYMSLSSIIGFVNSYFINQEFDSFVSDNRKIVIDNDVNSKEYENIYT